MSTIFRKFRPDITIVSASGDIVVWELTICHETNLSNSRNYKLNKYANLSDDLTPSYIHNQIDVYSIELSSLGLINNHCLVINHSNQLSVPNPVIQAMTRSVISNSYNIYRNRNFV